MGKLNVYVSSNNILTLAPYEVKEYYDRKTQQIKTKRSRTKLVGYMDAALVEELSTPPKPIKSKGSKK